MLRLLLLALRHRGLRAAGAVVVAFIGGALLAWRVRRLSQRREEARANSRQRMAEWLDTVRRGETQPSIAAARKEALHASAAATEARLELARAMAERKQREADVARLASPLTDLERAAGLRR